MSNNASERYQELDALRGIAALMVVLFHFTLRRPEGKFIFNIGYTGVELFFIISGFVIALTIQGVSKGWQFVVRRVSRLYPTYWAAVVITFFVTMVYNFRNQLSIPWVDFAANLTMFQYYFGIGDLDKSYWTMIIEMQFYLFVLILFVFHLWEQIELIGLLICTLVLAMILSFSENVTAIVFNKAGLFIFLPLFLSGIVFFKMISKQDKRWKNYLIISFCFALQLLIAINGTRATEFISFGGYSLMLSIYFVVFILFVNQWLRFLILKPLLFLGKISFPLYLIHQNISTSHIIPFLTNRMHINFWVASMGIALPFCILVATGITYFIEIRYNKKLRSYLSSLFVK